MKHKSLLAVLVLLVGVLILMGPTCPSNDADKDGVPDLQDNCPFHANPDQLDTDEDCRGNVCDNCDYVKNCDQADDDGDGIGKACDDNDGDADEDGVLDDEPDNCLVVPNGPDLGTCYGGPADGDPCDRNGDCPGGECQMNQEDSDEDDVGDVCDNCPDDSNENQLDSDSDSYGNVCDNCPNDFNYDQGDDDSDGVGDVCDNCPGIPNGPDLGTCHGGSADGDDCVDNVECPSGECQMNQEDGDGDGVGDVCDQYPGNRFAS